MFSSRPCLVAVTLAVGASLIGCGKSASVPDTPAKARNIVLFIGDGMGVATVTAARIFDGQSQGMSGEEHYLAFERFPNVALVKTYNTNQQVPDSAGTATAILTGTKTRAGVINVGPDVLRKDCTAALLSPLRSLGQIARERGKATGVVTTTRLTHATPATMYAQSPERNWDYDRYMPESAQYAGCRDIARQLVEDDVGGGLTVAMGGGRAHFFGAANGGARANPDDDLPAVWLAGAENRRFVTTVDELHTLAAGDQALGLFSRSHLAYMAEKGADSTQPTLTQMTIKALELLRDDEDGFFLMVEGGRIDHAHHDGKPGFSLTEAQEFNRAIEAVIDRVNLGETLLLVTADHSHVFTMGGYATRGNPILGLVHTNDPSGQPNSEPDIAGDGQPYTTLGYYNGPGAVTEFPRPAPETGVQALAQALVPMESLNNDGSVDRDETHGGEDVALYGTGPGSERVRGVIEQNRIFDIMVRALGWSDLASPE
ncbi:MAG: alkaline phosphatase [Pseudomonadota bacterium]